MADSAQAQKKSKKSKKSKKTTVTVDTVALPYNSNDCLFAIPLQQDVVYGPTTAPKGAGRLMEIQASASNPNVVECEHNSVWYKFVVPYNGELEIEVTQLNPADNYDMMIFKYTDDYFSNNLIQGKIRPVAATLSAVDTTLIPKKKVVKKGAAGQPASQPAQPAQPAAAKAKAKKEAKPTYHIGMKHTGGAYFLGRDTVARDLKSIRVAQGEVYYILLDNESANGGGHSIKVSLYVDAFRPLVVVNDPSSKTPVTVDLVILEKNTNNRALVKNPNFRTDRIAFVPGFDYTLYAKRQGFFTVYKEFNSNIFKQDTSLVLTMHKASKGSTFTVYDLYFTEDGKELLGKSDSVLLEYVMLFKNHPEVSFLIKGYVPTYGDVTMESDQEVSLERALTVKKFLMSQGIDASRMTISGMTPNEIRRAGAAANDPKVGLLKKRIEFVVTSIAK